MDFLNSTSTDILGLDFLSNISIRPELLKDGLFIFFLLFFLVYSIISAILFYHWQHYGMKHGKIFVYGTIFIVVSILLHLVAFIIILNI
jgi:hypothetical protein